MSRITIASVQEQLTAANTRIAELEAQVAARDARLIIATTVFKAQRATIRELESKLATRGCIDRTRMHVATDFRPENETPVVTTFAKRDGTVWEKSRIGNRAILREVSHA